MDMWQILVIFSIYAFCSASPVSKTKKEAVANNFQSSNLGRYLMNISDILSKSPVFVESISINNTHFNFSLLEPHILEKLHSLKEQTTRYLVELHAAKKQLAGGDNTVELPLDLVYALADGHPNKFSEADIKRLLEMAIAADEKVDSATKLQYQTEHLVETLENWSKIINGAKNESEGNHTAENHIEPPKRREEWRTLDNSEKEKEVWTKKDQFDPQDYSPKIFFKLHDVDGDGLWNWDEMRAAFELNDDELGRAQHLFKLMDTNKDHLISFDEHMNFTRPEASYDYDYDDMPYPPSDKGFEDMKDEIEQMEREYPDSERYHQMRRRLDDLQRQRNYQKHR